MILLVNSNFNHSAKEEEITILLLQHKSKVESEVAQSCPTLRLHELYPTRLFYPWNFPATHTGVGCHFLLQGSLLQWQADSLPLRPGGSPHKVMECGESFKFQNLSITGTDHGAAFLKLLLK